MITLVTGANAGLGRETAAALASAKHTVVLAGRRPAAVAEAVAEITARPGIDARVRAAPAPLDLASPASVAAFAGALAADLAARGERLGALVNNAGIAGADAGGARPTGHNAGAPDDAWPVADPLMATNAVGTHAVTRLLLPLLLEGAAADASVPRVVTLSSRAHRSSPPLHPATALAPGAGWPASSPPPTRATCPPPPSTPGPSWPTPSLRRSWPAGSMAIAAAAAPAATAANPACCPSRCRRGLSKQRSPRRLPGPSPSRPGRPAR